MLQINLEKNNNIDMKASNLKLLIECLSKYDYKFVK